jgi:hypothetical protein
LLKEIERSNHPAATGIYGDQEDNPGFHHRFPGNFCFGPLSTRLSLSFAQVLQALENGSPQQKEISRVSACNTWCREGELNPHEG